MAVAVAVPHPGSLGPPPPPPQSRPVPPVMLDPCMGAPRQPLFRWHPAACVERRVMHHLHPQGLVSWPSKEAEQIQD